MKKNYEMPLIRNIITNDFAFSAIAQSGNDFTLNFGPCEGGPTVFVQNNEFEQCFNGNPAGETALIQCSETGSNEYQLAIVSATPGSLSCGSEQPFIVQISVSDNFPPVCTVTRAIGSDHCDSCNNTPESLGNGNCNDGIDNDCDGDFDSGDINCAG